MFSNRTRKAQGFTLVEILIVVVILGILAAIVIPQFTSASESAKASSLVSQLQTIRSQLELYQVQHNGNYPDAMTDGADGADPTWPQMTSRTDQGGTVGTTDGTHDYGPYLQKFPKNPFVDSGTAADHWEYDADAGTIRAVIPASVDTTVIDPDDNTSDFVAAAAE